MTEKAQRAQNLEFTNTNKWDTRQLVTMALMCAIAALLSFIQIPLIPGVTFLTYDPSPVSYTHLDVYKRQEPDMLDFLSKRWIRYPAPERQGPAGGREARRPLGRRAAKRFDYKAREGDRSPSLRGSADH